MTEDKKIFATPKVRKFARELGANVSQIEGTERKGRITEGDVKNFVSNQLKESKKTYIEECLSSTEGPVVAASDYMRLNSDQIRSFTSKSFYSFGTDGYGRSDTRKNLRKFFEVDKEHIVTYTLSVLAKEQLISSKYAKDAMKKYKIDPEKPIPTKL